MGRMGCGGGGMWEEGVRGLFGEVVKVGNIYLVCKVWQLYFVPQLNFVYGGGDEMLWCPGFGSLCS